MGTDMHRYDSDERQPRISRRTADYDDDSDDNNNNDFSTADERGWTRMRPWKDLREDDDVEALWRRGHRGGRPAGGILEEGFCGGLRDLCAGGWHGRGGGGARLGQLSCASRELPSPELHDRFDHLG